MWTLVNHENDHGTETDRTKSKPKIAMILSKKNIEWWNQEK
jgi:hypothetical protein